jgi:cation:H+ antiporter
VDLLDAGRILAGLLLLTAGGESLVRGASALAGKLGISGLVVGLTVVSVATSAPELAVAVGAVLRGVPELAVGNVVGSNIANVLLILGIAALILPLAVRRRLLRLDVPFMVLLSVVFLALSLDGRVGSTDGLILFAMLILHGLVSVAAGRRHAADEPSNHSDDAAGPGQPGEDLRAAPPSLARSLLLVAGGVASLVFGAGLLVDGAGGLATAFGLSSLVVGLTVVSIGTSLPELAVAVIAVRRGKRDLAVGNVVGSNIANIGLVLGLPAMISPGGIPLPGAAVAFDIPLMLAAAVALLPVAFTGFNIARWEGGLFVALYVVYTGFVVLAATEHDALAGFTTIMAWFVLPLVAVTLVAFTVYEVRLRGVAVKRRRARESGREDSQVEDHPGN